MSNQEQPTQLGIEPEKAETVHRRISIEPAESYIYSNAAGVSISPRDIRVDFADVAVNGKSKTVAGITMSPEHAAGLVLILMAQLRSFEAQVGAIRTPQWKAMKE